MNCKTFFQTHFEPAPYLLDREGSHPDYVHKAKIGCTLYFRVRCSQIRTIFKTYETRFRAFAPWTCVKIQAHVFDWEKADADIIQ